MGKHTIKNDYLADVIALSVAQLNATLDFTAKQENGCTEALLRVLSLTKEIRNTLDDVTEENLLAVNSSMSALANNANDAIGALQFVDALVQRLAHILFELQQIAEFAESDICLDSTELWRELLTRIRAMYSMREERAVFDAVMADAPIGKLLDPDEVESDSDDTVELF